MTSKNLYFKLMKEDLKSRLWAVALIALGFFFLLPVGAAYMARNLKYAHDAVSAMTYYTSQMNEWVSFGSGMMVFVMMLASLICGMSSFSYLNSKSKVDFYHGIPVRREKLYLTNYLDGILILAVPYAVMLFAGVAVAVSNGAGSVLWGTALWGFGLNMAYFILMYTMTVVAVMLTGNLVVAFLGTAVLNFIVPTVTFLGMGYFATFFLTYTGRNTEQVMNLGGHFSPVVEYIFQVSNYGNHQMSVAAPFIALLAAAVLAVIGCLLYRKRPSEAAGRAMAFSVSKPVIQIVLVLVSALGLGLFFWALTSSTGWGVFGVLCGGIIAHCVIEIIYHFDFKKLFCDRLQLAGCLALSLLILIVFRYDLAGYDRYLPKESQVSQATLNVEALNSWVSYGETVKTTDKVDGDEYQWVSHGSDGYVFDHLNGVDVASVLEIAHSGIEWNEVRRDSEFGRTEDADEGETYSEATVCYTMKSGRKVFRQYQIPLKKRMGQLEKIYAQESFKKGIYPVLSITPDQVVEVLCRYMGPDFGSDTNGEIRLSDLSAEERGELLTAYQKDLQGLTIEDMKEESPLGLIRFASPLEKEGLDWTREWAGTAYYYYRSNLDTYNFYPVYPSFENTVRLLKAHGVNPEAGIPLEHVKYVTIDDYTRDEDTPVLEIHDPKIIAQIAAVARRRSLSYYDPLLESTVSDVDINFMYENGEETQVIDVVLPRGQVPDSIKEQLTNGQ